MLDIQKILLYIQEMKFEGKSGTFVPLPPNITEEIIWNLKNDYVVDVDRMMIKIPYDNDDPIFKS